MFNLPLHITLIGQAFSVEIIRAEDVPDILAVETRSHPTPWTLDNFLSSAATNQCIGLKKDGEWAAYGILSFVVGEAELLLFVVSHEWQGKGLGKAFLQVLLDLAQTRASTMFLEVRASNSRAIALYEGLGFNQVGLRKGYYPADKGKREDALVYAYEWISDIF